MGFLYPGVAGKYLKYLRYSSIESIVESIEEHFTYPLVIKPNKGSLGINVARCYSKEEVEAALEVIFNIESNNFDYVALAQEYIAPVKEFRVVFFRGKPVLSYQRYYDKAYFGAKYWEAPGGKTINLELDGELVQRSAKVFRPALTLSGLDYIALDIILTAEDELYLLELNSGPKYNHFADNHGADIVISMYETILTDAGIAS